MTLPRLRAAARPEVTVVMVTLGAEPFVVEALGALHAATEPVYEVVIVDNASPGGLAERLERGTGARVERNAANLGFGIACDQGAALARGRRLLFLNSDAVVRAGWLPPLLAALDRPGVAAAVPRLLNADGTLQEAGGLLYRDAVTDLHGFGDDPGRPAYRFPRVVDYGSAACLLVDRGAFERAGGFDPAYGLAYFEDVDLCLRLAARGGRVLYEPRSVVMHHRGASGGGNGSAGALWAKSREVFARRWSTLLDGRPVRPSSPGVPDLRLVARDAPALGRILVAAEGAPAPAALLGELARGWPEARVTLLAREALGDGAELDRLLAAGIEVASGEEPGAFLAARAFQLDAVIPASEAAAAWLAPHLAAHQPQALVLGPGAGLSDGMARAGVPAGAAASA